MSVTFIGSEASEVLGVSALSVAFAVMLPSDKGFIGVIIATPLLSVSPSPILFPSLSNNSTLLPGSAWTVIGSVVPPLPVKSVWITGLAGGVVSVTFIGSEASDVLGVSALSVAFAVTLPSGKGLVGVITALPWSSAVPSPSLFPSLSNNSTLLPGSAWTVIGSVVPPLPVKSVWITGFAGGVVSVTFIESEGSDVFDVSALSVAFAVTLPSGKGLVGVIVAIPLLSVSLSPILLPSLSNSSTFEPGSDWTVIGSVVPPFPVKSVWITGLAGGVVSVILSWNTFVTVLPLVSV